jgi:hypothetical protein
MGSVSKVHCNSDVVQCGFEALFAMNFRILRPINSRSKVHVPVFVGCHFTNFHSNGIYDMRLAIPFEFITLNRLVSDWNGGYIRNSLFEFHLIGLLVEHPLEKNQFRAVVQGGVVLDRSILDPSLIGIEYPEIVSGFFIRMMPHDTFERPGEVRIAIFMGNQINPDCFGYIFGAGHFNFRHVASV